jgi:two-component system, OmpR family, sensor histidine kinase VicK
MISSCTDANGPSVTLGVEVYKKGLDKSLKRGLKLRLITEINESNLKYCKQLAKISELRHLEGIRSNFSVSESEYIGSASLQDATPVTQIIYSNLKAIVDQQQYMFEALWSKAVPALQTIKQIEQSLPVEKTEVIYGEEQVVNTILAWQRNSEESWNLCVDSAVPPFSMSERIKEGYVNAKARGISIRYITEITKENLKLCREIMNYGQLRHLAGVVGIFAVSEKEYMGEASGEDFLTHLIYSNKKEIVDQQKYIFENLWNNSADAEKRIREIEEGGVPIETTLIENDESIAAKIKTEILNSTEIISCPQPGRLTFIENAFFDLYRDVLAKQARGEHKGIRMIVTIDKNVVSVVKKFVEAGVQVRHVKNLLPLSFVVTDKEVQVNLEDLRGRKMIKSLLTSNEPIYVKQFAAVFDQLWEDGIDAKLRIKDLEEGIENEIEVIQNPSRALELYVDTLRNAKDEILLIFPTANAVTRQEKLGIIDRLAEVARDQNVNARVLMPSGVSAAVEDSIQRGIKRINIRYIEAISGRATVLVADRKNSLVMELKDDSKDNFFEAIGLSTYSSSKAGVLSYVAMFENLWTQTDLMTQLRVHDKMQKEFINVAAHELRTPIQPILSITESLKSDVNTAEGRELLDIVIRNAERLQQLAEDILDVTRIESKTLHLNFENINLNNLLSEIVTEFRGQIDRRGRDIKIILESSRDINIEVDKSRISQVVSNLVTNAMRFTKHGNIKLNVLKNGNEIIISVQDTGQGIDPEVVPRLFTKFATKSITGTGLGLFISKSIVEAHGGIIRGENNKNGIGATFSLTLPFARRNI